MPALQQLYSENSDLLILGVWVGDRQSEALQTASQAGVQYPLLLPSGDLVTFAYKSQYIPATYFFDKNGKQVGEAGGYIGGIYPRTPHGRKTSFSGGHRIQENDIP